MLERADDLFSHVLVSALHAISTHSGQEVVVILIAHSADGAHIQKVSIWSYLQVLQHQKLFSDSSLVNSYFTNCKLLFI